MKKYIFTFMLTLIITTFGCKTTKETISKLPKNWLDESTYRITSIGYPSPNLDNTSYKSDSYDASYSLALAKITEAFIKEIPNFKDENYAILTDSIRKNIKVIKEEYNGKYSEITTEIKIKNLLTTLRKGVIVF